MKIKGCTYKEKKIFYFEEKYQDIGKKILNNDYIILKRIKDTKRNLVLLIEIDNKKYIYKEPRNEYRIPQRQIMTFLKNGEALTTLLNVNNIIEKYNFKEYARPYLAIIERKYKFIVYSAILFEYIDGKELEEKDLDKLILKMMKIHKKGHYHGDFNPSNFLIDKNNDIRILDTQAKKNRITRYRAHYDMITMQENYKDMKYPYEKNLSYFLAVGMKKFKRLKWVEKIKRKKKELRDKGWKI